MGRQVKIRIKGSQSTTPDEEIITEVIGSMVYKEPYYYVAYEEKADAEAETGSRTILRFSEKQLRVTRKGEIESTLEFAKGCTHNSLYMTRFGSFEVELITERLRVDCHENGASLEADYKIGFNSAPPAPGRLSIYIEEVFA